MSDLQPTDDSDGGIFRPLRADEAEAAARRTQLVLGATGDFDELVARLTTCIDQQQVWVLEIDGTGVVGQLISSGAEHSFGGRPVPCQHLVDVLVLPDHRGTGLGATLMRHAIGLGSRQGLGLSLLFPSTTAFYRRLGWEHAGTYTRWRVPTRLVPSAGKPMRPLDLATEWDLVEDCQRRFAGQTSGIEFRGGAGWANIRRATQLGFGLDGPDRLDAYALVRHAPIEGHFQHTMHLTDWAAVTASGLQAVVGFVGRHGTMARDAVFLGSCPHPWEPLLPEQDLVREYDFAWMARPLDAGAAMAGRGFSRGIAAAVTVRIEDPVVVSNRGPWRLEIADGEASFEPASDAEVVLDVTAVGPLFTGYRSASALAMAGRIEGTDRGIELLDAMFSGGLPTVVDFF